MKILLHTDDKGCIMNQPCPLRGLTHIITCRMCSFSSVGYHDEVFCHWKEGLPLGTAGYKNTFSTPNLHKPLEPVGKPKVNVLGIITCVILVVGNLTILFMELTK